MADFDFSTLVTDRSPSDLELLRDLLSTPMSDWTAEQLAAFNQAISKGAYNYTDLNRVTACMDYLNERLTAAGYKTGYQRVVVPHKAESGGLPVITEYRYLRMTITAIRDSGSIVQLSEIDLVASDNGADFPWPATTAVTSSIQAVSSEPAQNIIDGSTSTKFCSTAFTSGATLTIDLGEGNRVDLGLYNTWQWYTANDAPERDPVSFSLDVSNDGTHWLSVDSVSGASITETRQALAYSGTITFPTFTRVAYIESTGTEYIDTGFKQNQNSRIVMSAQVTQQPSTHAWLFEGRISSGSGGKSVFLLNGAVWNADYNGSARREAFPDIGIFDALSIDFDKNSLQINEDSFTWTTSTFQSTANLALLACNTAGAISGYISAKLYNCQIYDNGTLIRDFVPCQDPTGNVGLYDLVGAKFYGNAGTGAFIAGPEPTLDPYTWYEADVPTVSTMEAYLGNVAALRGVLTLPADTPTVPGDMAGLTQTEANQIEEILSVIHAYLEAMITVFRRCGAAICGGPGFYFVN